MSTEDLDAILDSADPDEIDALLERLEENEEGFVLNDDDSDVAEEETSETAAEAGGTSPAEAQPEADSADQSDGADSSGTESAQGIATRDGKNIIPYEVLENERRARQTLQAELDEALGKANEADKANRLNEILARQLEENGIDPDGLPEDFKLTDELKEQLIDDLGAAGKVLIALAEKQEAAQAEPVPKQGADIAGDDPVQTAIDSNPTLKQWQSAYAAGEDRDRFDTAVSIDERLRHDPAWANKSLDERFEEAVRRTQVVFGEVTESTSHNRDTADPIKDAEAEFKPPTSLSDLGAGATTTEKSQLEQLADMDVSDISDAMSGMNSSQIDALLSQIVD